jgi:hypothetical protein
MSTQFRSRVKSVVDFGTDLKSIGTCCYTNGTSEQLSFYECFIKNGTFLLGTNAECPDQGEQILCYACSYLTDSQREQVISNSNILTTNPTWGTKTVTKCECTRIGGSESILDSSGRDIRIPKACCFLDYNANGFPIGITCENVCSEKECSLKGITFETGELKNTPIYTADKLCSEVQCESSAITPQRFAQIVTGSSSFAYFDIGTCYTLTKINDGFTYSCDLKMLHDCSGYWTSSDFGNNSTIFCGHSYAPQVPVIQSGRAIEPETMSESTFDQLNLEIGDSYKGGIYIGKFIVNSPNSKVYGSLNLSAPEEKYYIDDTPRDTYTKWALIVDPTDYNVSFMTSDEMKYSPSFTSLSDGFYNCYGDKTNFYGVDYLTVNTIKGKIRNGFADYYIPSIIELYYLANSIRNNPLLSDILNIENNLTSSSIFFENLTSEKTNKSIFNGYIFNYCLSINNSVSEFGKTYLIPSNKKGNLRFFRKVILT